MLRDGVEVLSVVVNGQASNEIGQAAFVGMGQVASDASFFATFTPDVVLLISKKHFIRSPEQTTGRWG